MTDPAGETLPGQFAAALAALSPFETRPVVAVAVSGGADSLALCLLAHRWATAQGGRVVALTVDHGLRPGAAAEAAQVGGWLARQGIDHRILAWTGPKPSSGIQAAARAARYRLLTGWCRDAGVLHLLLGHHQGDQLETMLMRERRRDAAAAGLFPPGDTAMAPIVTTPAVRLLRPLLEIEPPALRSWLAGRDQPWVEDPANADRGFERVRVRETLRSLDPGDRQRRLDDGRAAEAAMAAMAAEVISLLAGSCRLDRTGVARLNRRELAAADAAVATMALGRVLTTVGGRSCGPDRRALARLATVLRDGTLAAATLHRCRLRGVGGDVEVSREQRNLPPPLPALAGTTLHWDGRFRIAIAAAAPPGLWIAARGRAGGSAGAGRAGPGLATLPALFDRAGAVALPDPGGSAAEASAGDRSNAGAGAEAAMAIAFQPNRTLSGIGRFVAAADCGTMSTFRLVAD